MVVLTSPPRSRDLTRSYLNRVARRLYQKIDRLLIVRFVQKRIIRILIGRRMSEISGGAHGSLNAGSGNCQTGRKAVPDQSAPPVFSTCYWYYEMSRLQWMWFGMNSACGEQA